MCLNVRKKAKKQTAKTDIIVYKRLYSESSYSLNVEQIHNGDNFTGVIRGVSCSGKIHKDENGIIYLCTNNEFLNGQSASDKFGYKYSWVLDRAVTSVIVNNDEKCKECDYITPYRETGVEIGETYKSSLVKNEDGKVDYGLHSFENLEDAKIDGGDTYVKCIIPKGSKYYIGKFNYCTSYASDTLKYVEIIE